MGGSKAQSFQGEQAGLGRKITGLAESPLFGELTQEYRNLAGEVGTLSPAEQEAFNQQLAAINAGTTGAEQRIQDAVRSQASARGLFSSRGAIADEAAQLANIPLFQAQQLANVYGQKGQTLREGLLSRGSILGQIPNLLQLQGQLYQGAGGLYQGAAQSSAAAKQANRSMFGL